VTSRDFEPMCVLVIDEVEKDWQYEVPTIAQALRKIDTWKDEYG